MLSRRIFFKYKNNGNLSENRYWRSNLLISNKDYNLFFQEESSIKNFSDIYLLPVFLVPCTVSGCLEDRRVGRTSRARRRAAVKAGDNPRGHRRGRRLRSSRTGLPPPPSVKVDSD